MRLASPAIGCRGLILATGMFMVVAAAPLALAQNGQTFKDGSSLLGANVLPRYFLPTLKALGNRMTSATNAQVKLTGKVTDAKGSRRAAITLQAPGYLRYEEPDTARVLTFDGSAFHSSGGQLTDDDERVLESLLAHAPDAVLFQLAAAGGTTRPLGLHFRTDDGTTPNYTGPWWALFVYTPGVRPGLNAGKALQQNLFIAIDEQSMLPDEIRVVDHQGTPQQKVTQTQFGNWLQQSGQAYPGSIVRLEGGQQVLRFDTQQASTGAQGSTSIFQQ